MAIDQSYQCGGTLINRDTVITAAHCIPTSLDYSTFFSEYTFDVTMMPSMYTIYLGMYNVSLVKSENLLGGVKMQVSQLIKVYIRIQEFKIEFKLYKIFLHLFLNN